jgi:putative ABC transport system ATP-binding protein
MLSFKSKESTADFVKINSGDLEVPNTVVEVNNLNFYFGKGSLKKQVLFDISLEIGKGEIVLMTGPSGSGKTTLLTLSGGLRSPQEGSLKVLGVEMNGASKKQVIEVRKNIGYIFQAHNLLASLTAQQNVQMAGQLHTSMSSQEVKQRASDMLDAVGLGDRKNYYPDNLSGGQKQRVAIARALMSHPKLVLADEPTAALDSKSGREVVEIMQSLAREQGTTILMVTHDNRILDVADRIVHMEDGCLSKNDVLSETVTPLDAG